jgi:hypothetical protein
MRAYKFTSEGGTAYNGFKWPLPTADGPGEWVEVGKRACKLLTGDDLCSGRALHATDSAHLLAWLDAEMYEVEIDESRGVTAADKIGFRRGRLVRRIETWNERTARLFACDCAEDALQYADPKQRDTLAASIAVARRYADGQATEEELSAARSAEAAAWSAAWSAAGAAEGAARSAAEAAAWSAAWSAAGAAEGAARSAAEAATWSATWSAAREAAREAAWSAARSAAGGPVAWSATWPKYLGWLHALLGIAAEGEATS